MRVERTARFRRSAKTIRDASPWIGGERDARTGVWPKGLFRVEVGAHREQTHRDLLKGVRSGVARPIVNHAIHPGRDVRLFDHVADVTTQHWPRSDLKENALAEFKRAR